MKKILLIMALLITTCLPVFSANWVAISEDEKTFIDTSSITPYSTSFTPLQLHNLVKYSKNDITQYSVWLKVLNRGSDFEKDINSRLGEVFWYSLRQYIVDCSKKQYAEKSYAFYNLNNAPITNIQAAETFSDYDLKWQSIVPETVMEGAYNLACTNNQYNANPYLY